MKNFEQGRVTIQVQYIFYWLQDGIFSIPKQERSRLIKHPDKSAYLKIIFLFLNQKKCCGYS